MNIRTGGGLGAKVALGTILFCLGGWLLVVETSHPPTHTFHVVLFLIIALMGPAVIWHDLFFGTLGQMAEVVRLFVPWSRKGRDIKEHETPK